MLDPCCGAELLKHVKVPALQVEHRGGEDTKGEKRTGAEELEPWRCGCGFNLQFSSLGNTGGKETLEKLQVAEAKGVHS